MMANYHTILHFVIVRPTFDSTFVILAVILIFSTKFINRSKFSQSIILKVLCLRACLRTTCLTASLRGRLACLLYSSYRAKGR